GSRDRQNYRPSDSRGTRHRPRTDPQTQPLLETILRAHWGAIAACDFFAVEVLTVRGLVRYYVYFVMELRTPCVEIAGISAEPHGAWMIQIARNLTDTEDGFLLGKTHLIPRPGSALHQGVSEPPPPDRNRASFAARQEPQSQCLRREVRPLHQVRVSR